MPTIDEFASLSEALTQERAARQDAETTLAEVRSVHHQFVSLMTHELRVPMTSIKGYTDLLLNNLAGPVNEMQTNFLHIIQSNVERMSRMVSELSTINKLEQQALTFTFSEVQVNTLVDEALMGLGEALTQKQHTLHKQIPKTLPAVWCDRARLIQALSILVNNAHRYTPHGGTIMITAEHRHHNGERVCIAVHDNGIGILAEEQAHIFEKFFRASDEETRKEPGNGLALHLAKLLITQQQGRIWFESARGKGSVFTIEIPVKP